ncbi:MAG: hypothetical protein IJP97_00885, partial [Synergistaceae bacterium]|nr:hypothetical protein [Synergistaceae bacterium]
LALAKAEGVDLTREQAEEYIRLMGARTLTDEELVNVAGGKQLIDKDQLRDIGEMVANGCSMNCGPFMPAC